MGKSKIHKIYNYRWDWSALPFLRMLIALIIGIGVYNLVQIRSVNILIILVVLLLIYFLLLKRRLPYRYRLWHGILIHSMTILLGYTMASYQDGTQDKSHFSNYILDEDTAIYGLITEIKERTNRYETVVCVSHVIQNDSLVSVSGNLNTYVPYKIIDTTLSVGQHIALRTEIIEHPEPRNPAVFDYGAYLSRKHIYHQTRQVSDIHIISACNSYKFWMSKHRERILKSLHKHIDDQSNYSIAASIILGYRDAVDYETKKAFAETGSIHILAVSGMHVGIIFLFLGLLINKINNHRKGYRYLKLILSLLGLWGFVLLAGAPPSAQRAAWLFTLILLGAFIPGKSNLYHRLCIAAFVMLLWNTNFLFDVGFQLSFTAIIGIAGFGPIWERINVPMNAFWQKIWDGMGMTIGATLGTLPLTMYYFHYFPVTGLISSIVVIAFATIILQLGVLFLICFWAATLFPWLEQIMAFVGNILNLVIGALQVVVHFFHSLPYGLISGISLSLIAVLLLYTLIISIRMLLNKSRSKVFVYTAVLSFLGLALSNFLDQWRIAETNQIVVYHDYQNNAIELFEGTSSVLISDEPVDDRYAAFLNQGLHIQKDISKHRSILTSSNSEGQGYIYNAGALKFGSKEMLIIKDPSDLIGKGSVHWDYILIVDNAEVKVEDIFNEMRFDQVIFGASNWQTKIDKWSKECEQLDIEYIDIKNTKAVVIEI